MSRKVYVGNLSDVVGSDELNGVFTEYGSMRSARVEGGLKTGETIVGFVQMESEEQGDAAIVGLDGQLYRGLPLVVRWALPGQDKGLNISRMFEPMNVPVAGEGRQTGGPLREDRASLRGDPTAEADAGGP